MRVHISTKAISMVTMHGISQYSSTNLNLNGFIHIYMEIEFDNTCLNDMYISNNLQYDIIWNVVHNKINKNDTNQIDTEMMKKLDTFLLTNNNEEALWIEVESLLQSGLIYTFIVNIQCIGDYYECNVNSTHELIYNYADIQCQINSNNIISIDNVDPINDLNIDMELNGLIFSYDPDNLSSKTHLLWNWQCIYNDISCKYLLNNIDSGVVNVNLSAFTFEYDSYYLFILNMMVSDNTNPYRDICIDSVSLQINTKNATNDMNVFIVMIAPISTEINVNDRLRIIGDIINYEWKDSIITKIPKIYYDGEDITYSISPIIINPTYHHLLYSIASCIIDLFQHISYDKSVDLYNLLSSALYISELIRISLSIPGETAARKFTDFSIYSVRVKHGNIAVSITNISVIFPLDITNGDNNKNIFDSVDILIVGINTSSINHAPTINDNNNCQYIEGTLSETSISINILGNIEYLK